MTTKCRFLCAAWSAMRKMAINHVRTCKVIIWLKVRLWPNIGFILCCVLVVLTCSAITLPNVSQFGWNLEHFPLSGAGSGGFWARSVTAGDPGKFFFVSKQCMISPIFHRPDLTKFEHNTSIGVTMNTFRTELLKFYCRRSIFWKMLKWLQISGKSLPTAQCIPLGQLPSASWYKYQSSSGWRRPRPLISHAVADLVLNGVEYRNSDSNSFICDDLATWCKNLVNFGSVTREFKRAKMYNPLALLLDFVGICTEFSGAITTQFCFTYTL